MHDVRDRQLLQETLTRYENLVNRPLLHDLNCLHIIPSLPCCKPIYLLRIETLPENNHSNYFTFILNALASLSEALGYFLCSHEEKLSVYIAIKSDCPDAFTLLQSGLLQTFPGTHFEVMLSPPDFLSDFFSPQHCLHIASTTVIPSASFTTPLLTQFTSLMGKSSDYAAFFLAHPLSRCDFTKLYDELCEVHNLLSIFNQVNFNHIHAVAKNGSSTISHGKTITEGSTQTETNSNSVLKGENSYTNTSVSSGVPCVYLNNNNVNFSYLSNNACSKSRTDSFSCAKASSCNTANSRTDSRMSGENVSDNHGISYSAQNIGVQNALNTLSTLIHRMQQLLHSTLFEYGAYFISPCRETSLRAAYSFMGLASDSSTSIGPKLVSSWSPEHASYSLILESLLKFEFPKFCTCHHSTPISHTTLIEGSELVSSFYLPF